MAQRTFGEDLATELSVKAAIWGPAIAGTVLLGPLGILLGLVFSAAIATSGGGPDQSQPPPPSNS
jgi:hypothetical protein